MAGQVPSADWELNLLLLKIAKNLDDDEFQSIKFLCSGQKGVPQGVLEKLSSPQKFFTHLRERRMLSRENLLLLQAFLWHLGRHDLFKMAMDYVRRVGDVLHFFAPDSSPENGYEHVKFHVEGDLDNFQRRELEDLRANVARLLFVPPEFVFVSGLEPANSLFITFMLHSFCAQLLRDIAVSKDAEKLRGLGVNVLYFGQDQVQVKELDASPRKFSLQEEQLSLLYQRTKELEDKVTELDIRAVDVHVEQEELENKLANIRAKEVYYRGLLCAALEKKSKHKIKAKEEPDKDSTLPLRLETGRFVI